MARKKKPVVPPNPTPEDVQAGLEILHKEYFMNVIAFMSYLPDQKEVSYVKVPIVTPEGGTYLVSLLHIDGPKINVSNLAKVSDGSATES